jgi:hypothetical protein
MRAIRLVEVTAHIGYNDDSNFTNVIMLTFQLQAASRILNGFLSFTFQLQEQDLRPVLISGKWVLAYSQSHMCEAVSVFFWLEGNGIVSLLVKKNMCC